MAAVTIYPASLSLSGRAGTRTGLPRCDPTLLQQIRHSWPQGMIVGHLCHSRELGCHILCLTSSKTGLSGSTWDTIMNCCIFTLLSTSSCSIFNIYSINEGQCHSWWGENNLPWKIPEQVCFFLIIDLFIESTVKKMLWCWYIWILMQ